MPLPTTKPKKGKAIRLACLKPTSKPSFAAMNAPNSIASLNNAMSVRGLRSISRAKPSKSGQRASKMRNKRLMVWLLLASLLGIAPPAQAESYAGRRIQEIQIACLSSEELINLLRKNVVIQPGDRFSPEAIRESIRNIYQLKRFSQITVEAEILADGGLRLSFCPQQIHTISKIEIQGNQAVAAETIRDAIDVNIGDRVPSNGMNVIKQRLLKLYRDQGYHQAQLSLQTQPEGDGDKVILSITIEEGIPSKIGTVTFTGNTAVSNEALIDASGLRAGMQFTLDTLERAVERIKRYYAEQGYREMTVTDRDVTYNFETAKADLTLTISEGQATQIRFEG
ncbi:hypothetical protein GF339_05975, partial [candidate division KSB3 bacterium]|nr:hypothetical protein [candidate division KSB3 bacterium]MBD3324111.1 hypothetical protein [candidate division KSB3 bacterium]